MEDIFFDFDQDATTNFAFWGQLPVPEPAGHPAAGLHHGEPVQAALSVVPLLRLPVGVPGRAADLHRTGLSVARTRRRWKRTAPLRRTNLPRSAAGSDAPGAWWPITTTTHRTRSRDTPPTSGSASGC